VTAQAVVRPPCAIRRDATSSSGIGVCPVALKAANKPL